MEMKSDERSCGFIDRSPETPFSHMLRSLKGHYTTLSRVAGISKHQRREVRVVFESERKKTTSACFIKNHE